MATTIYGDPQVVVVLACVWIYINVSRYSLFLFIQFGSYKKHGMVWFVKLERNSFCSLHVILFWRLAFVSWRVDREEESDWFVFLMMLLLQPTLVYWLPLFPFCCVGPFVSKLIILDIGSMFQDFRKDKYSWIQSQYV